jgi:hypothetical protein
VPYSPIVNSLRSTFTYPLFALLFGRQGKQSRVDVERENKNRDNKDVLEV